MPVYAGVECRFLARALDSVLDQTRPPDETVIVEDGPLPRSHRGILDRYAQRQPRVVRVRLESNQGAGVANQVGLASASGEWIVKADADDVNMPHRIETQLEAVIRSGVDVCGSSMLEFAADERDVVSVRRMPLTHREIGSRLRWNNPINHPTAFYRREAALEAGGYPPWRYMQDYALFARMFARGAQMENLDEALVLFRSSAAVTGRRRSVIVRRLEWDLQRELRALGLVGAPRMLGNLCWRSAFRMLPSSLVTVVSRRVLARAVAGNLGRGSGGGR
jgi:glycosyltransferase involved in cell wall biosynthesis